MIFSWITPEWYMRLLHLPLPCWYYILLNLLRCWIIQFISYKHIIGLCNHSLLTTYLMEETHHKMVPYFPRPRAWLSTRAKELIKIQLIAEFCPPSMQHNISWYIFWVYLCVIGKSLCLSHWYKGTLNTRHRLTKC